MIDAAAEAASAAESAEDALPAVGKVFEGAKRSLGAIFASSRGHQPRIDLRNEPSNVEAVDQTEFAPVMQKLRAAMSRHGAGYEGILVNGQIVALTDGRATIRYSHQHEASARMLERNGKRETVQQVLSELLNEPIGLTIEVEPEPVEPDYAPQSPEARIAPSNQGLQPRMPLPRAIPAQPEVPSAPLLTPEQKQKILETDPLVKAAVELFNGDIVKAD